MQDRQISAAINNAFSNRHNDQILTAKATWFNDWSKAIKKRVHTEYIEAIINRVKPERITMATTDLTHNSSCMDDFDPASLDAKQALMKIMDSVSELQETETVPIRDALGRLVAKEVRSKVNVPGHTNSAMDGYAIQGDDIPSKNQRTLSVIGTSWAGRPYLGSISRGECVRVMTGAAIPDNSDTVVMQEHVQRHCTHD